MEVLESTTSSSTPQAVRAERRAMPDRIVVDENYRRLVRRFHPEWNTKLHATSTDYHHLNRLHNAYAVVSAPHYADCTKGRLSNPADIVRNSDWGRLTNDDECMVCGASPSIEILTHYQTSFPRERVTVQGPLCRSCGRAVVRANQRHTMWSGWWSLFGPFTNALVIAQNIQELFRLRQVAPGEPSPADKPLTLVERPLAAPRGTVPALLLVLVAVAAICVGVAAALSAASGLVAG